MNFPSFVLLLVIVLALAYGIYRIRKSKGACEVCTVATCPVHENMQMESSVKASINSPVANSLPEHLKHLKK